MRRGTTPTHYFELPFDSSLISKAVLVYSQKDVALICKMTEDFIMDGNIIYVTLTQEETLKLNAKLNAEIQLDIVTTDGTAISSDIILESVKKNLYSGVI